MAGLPKFAADSNPIELPFALKKRLSNALVLIDGRPWQVFDEPTLGQDIEYRGSLVATMTRLLETGVGIIVISHDSSLKASLPFAKYLQFSNGRVEPVD
jgi:ABC-type multidrug transport system ATPase subunit